MSEPQQQQPTQQSEADLQEASSIRYGVELKIALLTSNHWAIYFSTEAETGAKCVGEVRIVNTITDFDLRAIAMAERCEREKAWERYEERHRELAAGEPESQVSQSNLEDMGL